MVIKNLFDVVVCNIENIIMKILPVPVKEKAYAYLNHEIGITNFEQWVYANADELEETLDDNTFFWLISFSYNQEGAKQTLSLLLGERIDKADYEKYRLLYLLYKTLDPQTAKLEMIEQFYDLYCKGYYFFDTLALGYGLKIDYDFELMSEEERAKNVAFFYPAIIKHIQEVIQWIENGNVVPTGVLNEWGRFEYIENRQNTPHYLTPKKWWQFWL